MRVVSPSFLVPLFVERGLAVAILAEVAAGHVIVVEDGLGIDAFAFFELVVLFHADE